MSEEWGAWIEHDGLSRPAKGTVVQAEYASGNIHIRTVGVSGPYVAGTRRKLEYYGPLYASSWIWSEPGRCAPIIRYRIRKPRGLTILESLIADLPAPVGPKVDA